MKGYKYRKWSRGRSSYSVTLYDRAQCYACGRLGHWIKMCPYYVDTSSDDEITEEKVKVYKRKYKRK